MSQNRRINMSGEIQKKERKKFSNTYLPQKSLWTHTTPPWKLWRIILAKRWKQCPKCLKTFKVENIFSKKLFSSSYSYGHKQFIRDNSDQKLLERSRKFFFHWSQIIIGILFFLLEKSIFFLRMFLWNRKLQFWKCRRDIIRRRAGKFLSRLRERWKHCMFF